MAMESDIQRQLAAGEGDPEYWEAVLPRLKIHAAKARLREIKAQMLEERLAAQEEKLDVAAAMGWLDDAEEELDEQERYARVVHIGCVFIASVWGPATMWVMQDSVPGFSEVISECLCSCLVSVLNPRSNHWCCYCCNAVISST